MSEYLNVHFLGQKIGQLSNDKGVLRFAYDATYIGQDDARELSNSLPLCAIPFDHATTIAFFSNILPDERVRVQLEKVLHLSKGNIFGLLKRIGGECAGAVSLYSEEGSFNAEMSSSYRILQDDEADAVLSKLGSAPLMVEEATARLSAAGAQDKLVIAFKDDKIAIPLGRALSTHIIKPSIKSIDDSVHNEFFCMRLAKKMNLPVPQVNVYWLKQKPYYLIERYDRVKNNGNEMTRVHQEDFCAALTVAPEKKYENEGGPSLSKCFDLLQTKISEGAMPGVERLTLLRSVIFNFLIGNGDAHGKNFSILYKAGGACFLTPFYDLLCTQIYHGENEKMAMKMGGEYRFRYIYMRHFRKLALEIGLKPDYVETCVLEMAKTLPDQAAVLRDELNKDEKTACPVYDEIISIISQQCQKIGSK